MKKRIKIDSALLSCIIIVTGFLFTFRNLYPRNPYLDDALDFLGFMVLLAGIVLRMSARGHKMLHSQESKKLVRTGPYTFVRNPMYFGSFLMGAGFIFMIWPWWSLPIFAGLFYARFIKEIKKEEKYLKKLAGRSYTAYCKKVPRLYPSLKQVKNFHLKKIVHIKEAFSTKEVRGLWAWPILAVVLESFQEILVFEDTIFSQTMMIFLMAAIFFVVGFLMLYQKK